MKQPLACLDFADQFHRLRLRFCGRRCRFGGGFRRRLIRLPIAAAHVGDDINDAIDVGRLGRQIVVDFLQSGIQASRLIGHFNPLELRRDLVDVLRTDMGAVVFSLLGIRRQQQGQAVVRLLAGEHARQIDQPLLHDLVDRAVVDAGLSAE